MPVFSIGFNWEWWRMEKSNEWSWSLDDACLAATIICKHSHLLSSPSTFKDALSVDFSRKMRLDEAHRKAYIQINSLFCEERLSLAEFPSIPQINESENIEDELLLEQHQMIGKNQYEKLNEPQKLIVDTILDWVLHNNHDNFQCVFIDGLGGSGKTFVYNTIFHLLRVEGKIVCNMAFTGITTTLLLRGKNSIRH